MPVAVEGHVPRLRPGTIQTLFAPNTAAAGSPAYDYMNDHAVYRDVRGKWHVIGTASTAPGSTSGEYQFAHGAADSLLGSYTRRPDIDPTGPGKWAFAPHVVTFDGQAYMFYGPKQWGLATSSDMETWTNQALSVTYPAYDLIADNTTPRDAMVLEDGGTYYKYITSVDPSAGNQNVVDVLMSTDLINWNDAGHALTLSGDTVKTKWSTAESPFVVKYAGRYYLFVMVTDTNARNDNYHQMLVFRSASPTDFGDFDGEKVNPRGAQLVTELPVHAPEVIWDPSTNKWYITTTGWENRQLYPEAFDGVAIIEMEWVTAPANEPPISNAHWSLHNVSSQDSDHPARYAFDRNPTTYWESGSRAQPHMLDINLGAVWDLNGLVYVPEPHGNSGGIDGVITGYSLYVSADGDDWGSPVASGTFDNSILDNNARKLVTFSTMRGQYIRFVSTAAAGGSVSRIQDLGVLGSHVSGPQPPSDRVAPLNGPPSFASASATRTVAENTASGEPLGPPLVAADPEDDTLTYSLSGTHANAFALDTATGQLSTKAPLDRESQDAYVVVLQVSDGKALDDSASDDIDATVTVTVTVTDVDEGPVAFDDAADTPEDVAVLIDVLDNDSDPENDPMTVTLVRAPGRGRAVVNSDNTVTYTPARDFHGQDSFTYRAAASGGSAEARVAVTVEARNDSPVFASSSVARSIVSGAAPGTSVGAPVTATDVDGDTLSYALTGSGAPSFNINSRSARITVAAGTTLDAAIRSTYNLFVTATDPSGAAGTTSLTITVTKPDPTTIGGPTVGGPSGDGPSGGGPSGGGGRDAAEVVRLWGADRYGTALAVARQVGELADGELDVVVLAGGRSWTDALTGGSAGRQAGRRGAAGAARGARRRRGGVACRGGGERGHRGRRRRAHQRRSAGGVVRCRCRHRADRRRGPRRRVGGGGPPHRRAGDAGAAAGPHRDRGHQPRLRRRLGGRPGGHPAGSPHPAGRPRRRVQRRRRRVPRRAGRSRDRHGRHCCGVR